MSFRDNLQHLRATRNLTQEQLAMLLGVSRQSVSKWEAERAYPEMDKLLKLCDLFDCTLDELVSGDVTVARPVGSASHVPAAWAPQDVTGYDEAARAFAWRLPAGVAVIILGIALAVLLSDPAIVPNPGVRIGAFALPFVGTAVGCVLMLPAAFRRSAFRKAHPFVEDFYTLEQKDQARALLVRSLVAGIGLIMAGFVAAVLLWADVWLASAACLALTALGVFVLMRGSLAGTRCNVDAYNRKSLSVADEMQVEALGDEALTARARAARRDRGVLASVMGAATAAALVLLFTPASRWFFLTWPVGALLYLAYKAIRRARGGI